MNDTRRSILESLADGPASGPTLADTLDVSRAAVWKHVEGLREDGFEIESGPDGYALTGIPAYNGPAIEYGLEAPFSIEYHESIASTNARARALASDGRADVVVLADEQTGGKGRLDREWSSPSGGIWMSVCCRPTIPPARAPLYTLAAAVATARTAREAGVDARIKWPNDVVVPGSGADAGLESDDSVTDDSSYRKLSGVLTEMEGETDRVEWLVVGIGVNANFDAGELPAGSTTLREELRAGGGDRGAETDTAGENGEPGDVDRRLFVQRLLEEFHTLRTDLECVLPAWRELTLTIGQRVRVELPDETVVGEAIDITEYGGLVIEDDGGRVTVSAGDCTHLRPT
ncbi:biotin--[acetyl-CoA-carboxylase] ligase [Halobacteria archaeon AArc-m2/3/4]|uniref:Biotin--[acetyl-CoA-carboxylase] ligase n=1 Tax=Natronoglomus mannanivorans TaxID=2979990 RepID=A0ABT2QKX0_9EURY|nr:biotin--[acetyl-CoA-carboxylase] ligase [Halobacteria archaeon AArc-m2/3/4]